MYIHTYIIYDSLRNKDFVKIKSEHLTPCPERDAEQIQNKTIFKPYQVAFVGAVKTEKEQEAGESSAADVTGHQRPIDNTIRYYITWT